MIKKLIYLSIPLLFGLIIAALAVAAPAQASKAKQGPVTPDHFGPPPGGAEVYGVVESFPEQLVGNWTVSGVVYTATKRTWFWMYGGPFYTGACVHIRYDPSTYNASLIESTRDDKCNNQASTFFYGLIEQVPANYTNTITSGPGITGTWVISGEEYVSTPYTRLDTHNGPLAVGVCAGVKYKVINGINQASLIRSELMYRCLGPVSFNQAYGLADTFPPDLYGAWIISDTAGMTLTFMTTPTTTQIITHGITVDTGTCIYVKYYADQGVNYAVNVTAKKDRYCKGVLFDRQPLSKIYATVDSMPTGTVTGTWMLAGVNFTATEQTRIEEENGPLAVGLCAEGKYDPTNGAMLFRKLESEEDHDCQAKDGSQRFSLYGVVEDLPPTEGYTGTWQVSGVSFQTTPSTTIEMRHGSLATGAYVKVYFTYDSTSGERTAQAIWTHVAPGFGRIFFHGRFGGWIHRPDGDQIILDGQPIAADPDIDMASNVQNGDMVWVNAYQDPTGTFVTQVSLEQQIFLPFVRP